MTYAYSNESFPARLPSMIKCLHGRPVFRFTSHFMTRKQFEKLVLDALKDLPEEFRSRLDNVEIVIEGEPTREDLKSVGLTEDDLLLGLYHGTPLTQRTSDYTMALPDRIVLYQSDIEDCCDTREQIEEEVRKTVIHEVAHFFGLEEDELPY